MIYPFLNPRKTNSIKKSHDQLKADRPTIEELKFIPKLPISILVENVRSVYNVGSIFRTADGFGAEKIFLTGFSPMPPRKDLSKTALGADESVSWQYNEDSISTAKALKQKGYKLLLIEQTFESQSIYDIDIEFPVCFILGNEVSGVSEGLSELADFKSDIPMHGIKQSLNVSVACGVIGYELARQYNVLLRQNNI